MMPPLRALFTGPAAAMFANLLEHSKDGARATEQVTLLRSHVEQNDSIVLHTASGVKVNFNFKDFATMSLLPDITAIPHGTVARTHGAPSAAVRRS